MWRNYLTVALRGLIRDQTYAAITIVGLAIGMAACLMILLFVRYEFQYDRWLPGAADTYQFQNWYHNSETGQNDRLQMTSYRTGEALRKDFPQVERVVYLSEGEPVFFERGQASSTENYYYVDGNFLDVVALPVLRGDPRALDHVGNAAMTRGEAVARFGTDQVLGRTITLISKGRLLNFRIGVILRDIPRNSHMRIRALMRPDFRSLFAVEPHFFTCWGCQNGWAYVRLRPGSDPAVIERGLPAWEKRNIADEVAGGVRFNAGDDEDWHLVRVTDVHLGPAQLAAMSRGNDQVTVLTFAVIALLILGAAVVNFTNLATARANQRAREVALRKVLGASRTQLIAQFVGESLIVAVIAMLIALSIVELLMPSFSAFLDADLSFRYFGPGGVAGPVVLLVLLVGILGGLYPAFFLSRFQPAAVLKANRSASETPGSGKLRNTLVVSQFAVSIALIICTAVIYAQTVYARTFDPGFDRSHLLQVEDLSRYQLINKTEAIAEQVRRLPGIEAVGLTGVGLATANQNNSAVLVPGKTKPVDIGTYYADEGFRRAMGLRLLAGRWLDRRPGDDMTLEFPLNPRTQEALVARGGNVVLTVLATKRLGFRRPADAVGTKLRALLVDNQYGPVPVTVVGVIEDPRFRSIKLPLEPLMLMNAHTGFGAMVVRFHGDPREVRAGVERIWKAATDEVPFTAKFSDEIMQRLYRAEDARAQTFAAFAVLSVIVGCLGLFGLAAFTAERRTKEIGIRKVLGARTVDIVRLLAWQFTKPVIVANLIAWPVAWWLMHNWLNGFNAHIALGPIPFLLAAALALLIAIGTIAGHAFRVARANPIHALRYE